jgi:hypothetical protein
MNAVEWVSSNCRFADKIPFRDEESPGPQKLDIWRVRNAIPGCADARPAIITNVDEGRRKLEILPLGSQESLFDYSDPAKNLMLTRHDNDRMNLLLDEKKSFSYALNPIEVPMDWLVPGRIGPGPCPRKRADIAESP